MSNAPRRPLYRQRRPWIVVAAVVLLCVLAYVARSHLDFISEGWSQVRQANPWWLLGGAIALAGSMMAQAEVMVVLLRSAGVRVLRRKANALSLAANAWSASFPGGPALAAALTFREQSKWGASPVVASWYIVLSGAISGAGMAVLGLGSVFFLGLRVKPVTLAVSVLALAILALGMNWIARHPQRVEDWLLGRLRWVNTRLRKPRDRGTSLVIGFADQLSVVDLPLNRLGLATNWSLWNWVLEIVCLVCCVQAIGGQAPIAGVVLSFITAKLVGQAQVTPGGLGTVDAALTTALVAFATLPSGPAFAAVIVYRMLSFIGLTAVGWIVFFTSKLTKPAAPDAPHTTPAPAEARP